MATDWNMPRQAERCAACDRSFDAGEEIQVQLYASAEGYTRSDFCASCLLPDEPSVVGVWRTRRPPDELKSPQVFDRAAIYALFQNLEDTTEVRQIQLRFVLALMLWRKRVIQLERSIESDNRSIWEFSVPKSDTVHRVERPDLAEDELESLSLQLEALMSGQPFEACDLSTDLESGAHDDA